MLPWLVGAAAASLALFAGGFAAGQYLGARSGAAAALSGVQASRGTPAQVAAHAERIGTLYVEALAALNHLTDSTDVARPGPRRGRRRSRPSGPSPAKWPTWHPTTRSPPRC